MRGTNCEEFPMLRISRYTAIPRCASDAERREEILVFNAHWVRMQGFLELLQVPDFHVILLAENDDVILDTGIDSQPGMDQKPPLRIDDCPLSVVAGRAPE